MAAVSIPVLILLVVIAGVLLLVLLGILLYFTWVRMKNNNNKKAPTMVQQPNEDCQNTVIITRPLYSQTTQQQQQQFVTPDVPQNRPKIIELDDNGNPMDSKDTSGVGTDSNDNSGSSIKGVVLEQRDKTSNIGAGSSCMNGTNETLQETPEEIIIPQKVQLLYPPNTSYGTSDADRIYVIDSERGEMVIPQRATLLYQRNEAVDPADEIIIPQKVQLLYPPNQTPVQYSSAFEISGVQKQVPAGVTSNTIHLHRASQPRPVVYARHGGQGQITIPGTRDQYASYPGTQEQYAASQTPVTMPSTSQGEVYTDDKYQAVIELQ